MLQIQMGIINAASYLSAPNDAMLYRTIMRTLYIEKESYHSQMSTEELFDSLKQYEDFSIHRRHLYAILQKRNMHDYLQQKIDDGELREVWDYLKSYPPRVIGLGVDQGHNLTKQLADAYPQEICEQYWNECEILCSQSNKNNYRMAVHILVEIKKICKKHKMTEEWKSRYYAFLEKHKRKPLLMGYIQSEKALQS